MRHLIAATCTEDSWCGRDGDLADDPNHSDCTDCLREAAGYGACAAQRCAALEAGATRDPELQQERDNALRVLAEVQKHLVEAGGFACEECHYVYRLGDVAFEAGPLRWCRACRSGT